MNNTTIHVGLDVHKKTTAVLCEEEDGTVIYNPSLVALLQYAALLLCVPLNRIFRV